MHACAPMHTTNTYIHSNTLDWEILFLRNCALHAAKNCSVPTVFSNYGKVISGRMATLNNNNKDSLVDAATLHDFLLHLNFRHVKISKRIMATAISICIMMLSTSFRCKQLDVLWLERRDCFLWSFSALHEFGWGLSLNWWALVFENVQHSSKIDWWLRVCSEVHSWRNMERGPFWGFPIYPLILFSPDIISQSGFICFSAMRAQPCNT